MFRQIVSNLPFSPTLVGQLGFYAKRLKKEEVTRRSGLVLTALALVLQSLTVFTPPKAANAANPGQVGDAPRCDVVAVGERGSAFTIVNNDTYASVDFKVSGPKNCKVEVSANSFYAPTMDGRPYDQQVLADRNTRILEPREEVYNMKVTLPVHKENDRDTNKLCFYQVDLTYGTYNVQPVLAYGHGKVAGCQEKSDGGGTTTGGGTYQTGGWIDLADCSQITGWAQDSASPSTSIPVNLYFDGTAGSSKGWDIGLASNPRSDVQPGNHGFSVDLKNAPFDLYDGKTHTVYAYAGGPVSGTVMLEGSPKTFGPCVPPPQPPPSTPSEATCSGVSVSVISRTNFRFDGRATTSGHALVSRYSFTVYDSTGKFVTTLPVDTSALNATVPLRLEAPGTYKVVLTVTTSAGDKTSDACQAGFIVEPPRSAECKSIDAKLISRTSVTLSGTAEAKNGATLGDYTFTVKKVGGAEVYKQTVKTAPAPVATNTFSLKDVGDYEAQLRVATSEGEVTGPNCVTKFTIVPPETCLYNPNLTVEDKDCQVCPGNSPMWFKDVHCIDKIIETKQATNMTQGGANAAKVVARAGDRISYTLTAENIGKVAGKTTVSDQLTDILEYSKIIQNGGGTYNEATKTLSWPEETLKPGEKSTHTIVVQVLDTIPSTNTGVGNATSYDCRMANEYGNIITIAVDCPAPKVLVEQVIRKLPSTGPTENMLFAGIVGSVVTFFYARSKQLGREVKLVRKEFNMGTI